MLGADPPAHHQTRKRVNGYFTRATVAALEGRIRILAAGMAERFAEAEGGDLMAVLARPLPVRVIADMLGIDPRREDVFIRWSNALVALLEARLALEELLRLPALALQSEGVSWADSFQLRGPERLLLAVGSG